MNQPTNKEFETLCWYCKRNPAYGVYKCQEDYEDYQFTCPWIEDGKEIEGWDADIGVEIVGQNSDGTIYKDNSYCIKNCPLFVKGMDETTYYEYLDMVYKKTGYNYANIHGKTKRYLERFEKEFGEKVPSWVWLEYYFKQYEREQKLQKEQKNEGPTKE